MRELVRKLQFQRIEGEERASAVEYGLLVAAIAAIIILVVFALGTFVKGAFKDTCDCVRKSNAVNSSGPARTTATSSRRTVRC